MNETFLKEERVEMENVLQKDVSVRNVLSSVTALPNLGDAYVDYQSLLHQFRVFGRGQRTLFTQQILLNNSSVYRLNKKRIELLFHTIHRIYNSLPRQSWSVSSYHYVFGLRHILI